MTKKTNGFTLMELLVVIGVIGVLLSFVTVTFSGAQKQSRDARRKQDLAAIQGALEQYYSQNSFVYPVCTGSVSNCSAIATLFTGSTIPSDPVGGTYVYTITSSTTGYTVTATLEKTGGTVTVRNLQ